MEVSVANVLRMLEMIAEEMDDRVAENVIMAARQLPDDNAKVQLAQAVADGLGVSLV